MHPILDRCKAQNSKTGQSFLDASLAALATGKFGSLDSGGLSGLQRIAISAYLLFSIAGFVRSGVYFDSLNIALQKHGQAQIEPAGRTKEH
jgi:hypothetical protein